MSYLGNNDHAHRQLPNSQVHHNDHPHRYVSSLCRTGPMPLSRHSCTDLYCLIIFILLFLLTFILFLINLFSMDASPDIKYGDLGFFNQIAYGLSQFTPFVGLSCATIIALAIIFLILTILIPQIMGFFAIFACFAILSFIMYLEIVFEWGNVWKVRNGQKSINLTQMSIFRILLCISTGISLIALILITFKRRNKIKHIGNLLGIIKAVIRHNFPLLPILFMFIMSGISLAVWWIFTSVIFQTVQFSIYNTGKQVLPIPPAIIFILVSLMWIWIHGLLIAVSDYLCQSWIVHWYFNSRKQEAKEDKEMEKIELGEEQNWRFSIFSKFLKFHFGTTLIGAFLIYTPQIFVRFLKKKLKKREEEQQTHHKNERYLQKIDQLQQNDVKQVYRNSNKNSLIHKISRLSRYFYIETVLQCLNFNQSQTELFELRKRIKTKTPQIYMLGHFFDDVLKIMFIMSGIYILFTLSFSNHLIEVNFVSELTPGVFVILGLITGFGIFLQISTYASHLFGMISDTVVITHSIDCQIQRVHFRQNQPNSLPQSLFDIFQKLQLKIRVSKEKSTRQSQVKKEQKDEQDFYTFNQPMYESQYIQG